MVDDIGDVAADAPYSRQTADADEHQHDVPRSFSAIPEHLQNLAEAASAFPGIKAKQQRSPQKGSNHRKTAEHTDEQSCHKKSQNDRLHAFSSFANETSIHPNGPKSERNSCKKTIAANPWAAARRWALRSLRSKAFCRSISRTVQL